MHSQANRSPQSPRQSGAEAEPEAKENAEKARRRKLHEKQAQSLAKFSTGGTYVEMSTSRVLCAHTSLANLDPHSWRTLASLEPRRILIRLSLSLSLSLSLPSSSPPSPSLFALSSLSLRFVYVVSRRGSRLGPRQGVR